MAEAQGGLFEVAQATPPPVPAAPRRLVLEVSVRRSTAAGPETSDISETSAFAVVLRDEASGERLGEQAETCSADADDDETPEVRAAQAGMLAGLDLARESDPSADVEVRVTERAAIERWAGEGDVVWTWVPRGDAPAADALAEAALSGTPTARVVRPTRGS